MLRLNYSSAMVSLVFVIELRNGHPGFWYGTADGTQYQRIQADTAVQPDTWSHIVVAYDGSVDSAPRDRLALYVNGALQEMTATAELGAFPFDTGDADAHLAFGVDLSSTGAPCGTDYYRGLLDEVAVWDTLLSAQDVEEIHQRGVAGASVW